VAKINANRLCDLVDSFVGTKITVFGDLIVDEYVWGSVDRVSPEAPIVVVEVTSESLRLGGAANVANNLNSLGAQSSLVAVVGNDATGESAREMLSSSGINTEGIVVDESRPTTRKTRVIAHSQQVVRVDREVSKSVDVAVSDKLYHFLSEKMQTNRALIVSDYGKGVVTDSLSVYLKNNLILHDNFGHRVPIVVDPKGSNYSKYVGGTCVKPNKKEATVLTGKKINSRGEAISIAEEIRKNGDYEQVMITLGQDGLVLVQKDQEPFELDTIAQDVFDVSGAGDTVSAVYTLSLAVGATPIEASIIANCAAARVIREVGTATLEPDELKAVIKFWEENL